MMQHQVVIRVSVSWWLRWYLAGVALMCRMTGCQPDADRVAYWVRRAIKLSMTPQRLYETGATPYHSGSGPGA